MPLEPGPVSEQDDVGRTAAPTSVRLALVVLTVVGFVGRLWLARSVVSPFMFHDEGIYLTSARALLGDSPEFFGPRYAPGYAILTLPLNLIFGPGDVHVAAQVLNAAALAAVLPASYAVARRLGRLSPGVALAAAVGGGSLAGPAVQASMLLPESLLVLATVATVLLLHRWLDRPSVASGLALGSVAASAYALHTRGIAVTVATSAAVAAAVASRRAPPALGAVPVAVAAATVLAAQAAAGWITRRSYPLESIGKEAGDVLVILHDPLGVARTGVGHTWYLLLATGGLALLGAALAGRTAVRQFRSVDGLTCAAILLGFLVSVALSAVVHRSVAVGVPDRPDKVVYGRYVQQWGPVLVALAPAIVHRWSRRAATLASAVVGASSLGTAVLLHTTIEPSVWARPVAWHNSATLWLVFSGFDGLWVVRTAVVFGLVVPFVLGVVVRANSTSAWTAALMVIGVVGTAASVDLTRSWAAPASEHWAASHQLGEFLEEHNLPVGVDVTDATSLFHSLNMQFWHPSVDVDLAFGADAVNSSLRIAPLADGPPENGAQLLATEPAAGLGLWAAGRDVVASLKLRGVTFPDVPSDP